MLFLYDGKRIVHQLIYLKLFLGRWLSSTNKQRIDFAVVTQTLNIEDEQRAETGGQWTLPEEDFASGISETSQNMHERLLLVEAAVSCLTRESSFAAFKSRQAAQQMTQFDLLYISRKDWPQPFWQSDVAHHHGRNMAADMGPQGRPMDKIERYTVERDAGRCPHR